MFSMSSVLEYLFIGNFIDGCIVSGYFHLNTLIPFFLCLHPAMLPFPISCHCISCCLLKKSLGLIMFPVCTWVQCSPSELDNLPVATSQRKMIPLPQLTSSFSIHVGMPPGLILCRSWASHHNICQFLSVMTFACHFFLWNFNYFFSCS